MRTKCPTICPSYKSKITACKEHLGHKYKLLSNYTDGAEKRHRDTATWVFLHLWVGSESVSPCSTTRCSNLWLPLKKLISQVFSNRSSSASDLFYFSLLWKEMKAWITNLESCSQLAGARHPIRSPISKSSATDKTYSKSKSKKDCCLSVFHSLL